MPSKAISCNITSSFTGSSPSFSNGTIGRSHCGDVTVSQTRTLNMKGKRHFKIEYKHFEAEGGPVFILRIFRRERFLLRSVLEGARWLMKSLEELVMTKGSTEFIKPTRGNGKAFVMKHHKNTNGLYLVIAEYGKGGRKGW